MRTVAILTAAGSGSRLGSDRPKALVELAGEPLVVHAARALLGAVALDRLVVTAPAASVEDVAGALATVRSGLVQGRAVCEVGVVPGGPSRQASVAAGLASLGDAGLADDDVVLVHDAARPLVGHATIRRVVDGARRHGAVVPGLTVADTVKVVDEDGRVTATPDRRTLRAVQTPQGFTWAVLSRAHEAGTHRAGDEATAATDDAGLVEDLGLPVHVVVGDAQALKITTTADLELAETLLSRAGSAR